MPKRKRKKSGNHTPVLGVLGEALAGIGLFFLLFSVAAASHSADLTGDGKVDSADLAVLKTQWGGTGTADLNHNGTVNAQDAGILFSTWGTLPTEPPPPPPPAGSVNPDWGVANAHWDNFNRTDNSSLGTIASFVWRSWSDYQGDLRITSNRVVSATPTTWSLTRLVYGGLSIPNDHWIQADLKLVSSGDIGLLAVRKEDNTDRDFYALEWRAGSGSPTLNIVKWVGGAQTVLQSISFGAIGETHTFQLVARGATLVAFADGTEKLRVSDSTYPSTNTYQWLSIGLLGRTELDNYRHGQYADTFTEPSGATYRSGTRNAWEWPFDQNSPWNRPIGTGATYTPLTGKIASFVQSTAFSVNSTNYSVNVYRAQTTDPVGGLYVYSNVYGGYHQLGRTNIPANAIPSGGTDGAMAIVEPNGEYSWGFYGAQRCLDGFCGRDLRRYRLSDSGRYPVFIGSNEAGQPAITGLVRKGELINGIYHPIYSVFWPYLLNNDKVWPANSVGSFGCDGCVPDGYDSSSNVRHGTLLAIPPSINIDTLGITHPKAKIVAKAMQDYGLYVLDKGGNMVIEVEGSAAGEVPSGTDFTTFRNELLKASKYLQVVGNNGPNAVGGGGTPKQPLAPPFAP